MRQVKTTKDVRYLLIYLFFIILYYILYYILYLKLHSAPLSSRQSLHLYNFASVVKRLILVTQNAWLISRNTEGLCKSFANSCGISFPLLTQNS